MHDITFGAFGYKNWVCDNKYGTLERATPLLSDISPPPNESPRYAQEESAQRGICRRRLPLNPPLLVCMCAFVRKLLRIYFAKMILYQNIINVPQIKK